MYVTPAFVEMVLTAQSSSAVAIVMMYKAMATVVTTMIILVVVVVVVVVVVIISKSIDMRDEQGTCQGTQTTVTHLGVTLKTPATNTTSGTH